MRGGVPGKIESYPYEGIQGLWAPKIKLWDPLNFTGALSADQKVCYYTTSPLICCNPRHPPSHATLPLAASPALSHRPPILQFPSRNHPSPSTLHQNLPPLTLLLFLR